MLDFSRKMKKLKNSIPAPNIYEPLTYFSIFRSKLNNGNLDVESNKDF